MTSPLKRTYSITERRNEWDANGNPPDNQMQAFDFDLEEQEADLSMMERGENIDLRADVLAAENAELREELRIMTDDRDRWMNYTEQMEEAVQNLMQEVEDQETRAAGMFETIKNLRVIIRRSQGLASCHPKK